MSRPRTLVVTVPNMVFDDDLAPLRAVSDVDYREMSHIAEDDLAALCGGYDYLMLNYDVVKKLSDRFYEHQSVRDLKALSADITGMDWASPSSAKAHGLLVLNIPHYSTESVAESILAEVLLHSRQRHAAYMDEIRGREVTGRKGINLRGKTAGVVGLGSIGTRVAELLEAVGMGVVAWNRTPRERELVSIEELFDRSRVVCLCLKTVRTGSEKNTGLVDDDLLARCDETIVVNLANASLVDHDAMVRRLQSGQVAGYTVERSQPLLESPLAELDTVHMPPANAWFSEESLATLRSTWVGNVTAVINGQPRNVYAD